MTVDPTYLLGAGAYLLTGVLYGFYRWLNYVRVKANQVNSQIVPTHLGRVGGDASPTGASASRSTGRPHPLP